MPQDADDHVTGSAAAVGRTIVFTHDEARVTAFEGESLAAALVRHGRLTLSAARDGSPRGVACGMGVCQECRVIVDGRPGQRACLTKAAKGMIVTSQATPLDIAATVVDPARWPALPGGPIVEEPTDILIVGAGPAGLAAALTLREAGATVIVVDERHQPGGQYFKQVSRPGVSPVDDQAEKGHERIVAAHAAGVVFRQATAVWGAFREGDELVVGTLSRDRRATSARKSW